MTKCSCRPVWLFRFSSVQSLSRVRLFATPWIAACQASLSITNSQSVLKLMPIESVKPSSLLILCRPLLLLTAIPPSSRVFSNESTLRMRWPKYWSFSFSISPSNEHPGLISFRTDWLDLPAVQGTLKSLLQHHSSKTSILQHSSFFTVQLSHPYMTTGKTIALTRQIFVSKLMSLLYFVWLFRPPQNLTRVKRWIIDLTDSSHTKFWLRQREVFKGPCVQIVHLILINQLRTCMSNMKLTSSLETNIIEFQNVQMDEVSSSTKFGNFKSWRI